MAVANIQVGNWMLIDPVIPYQLIIANPENRAIANGRYIVYLRSKWKPPSELIVSTPATKIVLSFDNGKRRFKRLRLRKRLSLIAQRTRLTRALCGSEVRRLRTGCSSRFSRIERRRHGYDDRTDICWTAVG